MNPYYAGRSSRPARFFSLGLLDVLHEYACVALACEKPRRTSVSTASLRDSLLIRVKPS